MNLIKDSYENGECPDCGEDIPNDVSNGDGCSNCSHVFYSPVKPDITEDALNTTEATLMDKAFESIKTYLIEDTLFILRVEDMVAFYDVQKGEGSYDKLSDQDKTELHHEVKRHLEYGLGEAWADYMREAVQLAQEDWRVKTDA
jgi:hypothetical protein